MIQPAALSLLNLTPGRATPSPVASGAVFALPGDGGDAAAMLLADGDGGGRQADAAPGNSLPLDLATSPASWSPLAPALAPAPAAIVELAPLPAPAFVVEQLPAPVPDATIPSPIADPRDPSAEQRLVSVATLLVPSSRPPVLEPAPGRLGASMAVTTTPLPLAVDREAPTEQPLAPAAKTVRSPAEPAHEPMIEPPVTSLGVVTAPLPTTRATRATREASVEQKPADELAEPSPPSLRLPSTRARKSQAPADHPAAPDAPVAPVATSVSIDVRTAEQGSATLPPSVPPSSPSVPPPPVPVVTTAVQVPPPSLRPASTASETLPRTSPAATPRSIPAPASGPVERTMSPPAPASSATVADPTTPMPQDAAVDAPSITPHRDVAERTPAQPFRFAMPSTPPVLAEVQAQSVVVQPAAPLPLQAATTLPMVATDVTPAPARSRSTVTTPTPKVAQEPRPSPTPMVAPAVALPLNWQRVVQATPVAPASELLTTPALVVPTPLAAADGPVTVAAPVLATKEAPAGQAPSDNRAVAPVSPSPMPVTQAAPAALVFGAARFAAQVADDRDEPTLAPALGMAPLAAPATVERPAVAAPSQAPLDMTREQWPTTMIERIEMIRDAADEVDTRIRLIPDALGAIDVAVKRDGDTLHVRFQADQPQTRTLLADAAPRLAEAAEVRGLRLGQTSVGGDAGATGHGNQPHQQRPSLPAAPPRAPRNPVADDTADDDTRLA